MKLAMNELGKNQSIVIKDIRCPKCNTSYGRAVLGVLTCPNCGNEEQDDYGIVRTYIEKNGTSTALEIARDTGVGINKINSFLRAGRLEIPESSNVFIACKKCGRDIRFGKYCPSCAKEMAKELKDAFDMNDVGEVPRGLSGKMHTNFMEKHK